MTSPSKGYILVLLFQSNFKAVIKTALHIPTGNQRRIISCEILILNLSFPCFCDRKEIFYQNVINCFRVLFKYFFLLFLSFNASSRNKKCY